MSEVKKVITRQEQRLEDTWALEDLYESDEKWQEEKEALEKLLMEFEAYPGAISKDAHTLYEFLTKSDDAGYLLTRLIVYSNEKMHQDMSVATYQSMASVAQTLVTKFSGVVAFAEPEILQIPEKDLEDFYAAEPGLEKYRIYLGRVLREKEHTLSDKEEAILAASQEMASAASDIRALFANADLKYGTVRNEKGEEVEITDGNYVKLLMNNDRSVRKSAFETYYKVYDQFRNSIGAMFQANVKQGKFYADMRHYGSTREMKLSNGQIPTSVYDSLIEAVHEALPDMYRYVALRKKVLGVEELHMYDVYAPLVNDYDASVTFEEAKKMVLEGLAPMGEEYLSFLREGFENRWIDVYENRGKRSGAYSWGAYGTHPYVLLNFQGKLDDVFTLAHEMGHALHTYYTNKTQPYTYADYLIFVAEVASTCNESLLMQHLLKNSTDKKEKLYLMNYFLDQFKGTVFRQTMFAEFEKITHEKYAQGEPLTAENLCEIYLELNKKYFGEEMVSDPQIALEWARIPHFYTEFYVYQYATGFAAAIALSQRILKEGAPAVEEYKKFLKGGCSKDPIDLLKLAGVDMSSPEPVKAALKMFGELIREMEAEILS